VPELPEVESVRRSLLRSGLAGRTIIGADIGWAKTVKFPSAEELTVSVAGRSVQDVARRAKYLLFR
jgi:formamidopyrimidine-DNA glycosylase